jgi:hypothetical protein
LAPKLIYEPHRNNHFNRYLKHQLTRMRHASPMTYWRMAMHLMRRSNVFFVIALNHVFPHWSRNMRVSSVVRLAIAVRRIASQHYTKLDYKRVYIPKDGKDKYRPLGVPSNPYRIYLHMMNQCLVKYLEERNLMSDSQHGFRPERGTLTAWKKILTEVINQPDIYEFDLKQFFPSVNLDAISSLLIKLKIPPSIVRQIHYFNCSAIKLKPPYKLNEYEEITKRLIQQGAHPDEVMSRPKPISYLYRVRGVPQGAPTSPVLSTLLLPEALESRHWTYNENFPRNMRLLMYADDGLYYGWIGNEPITPNSGMVTGNIKFNMDKSGWVKKNGQWLRPLKFVGLEYNGWTDKLRASTKLGSNLLYDKEELVRLYQERELDSINLWFEKKKIDNKYIRPHSMIGSKWDEFVKSKLSGFMQSRLFAGSWTLEKFYQDFELNATRDSYADLYQGKSGELFTVFNVTSYASEFLCKQLKRVRLNSDTSSWKDPKRWKILHFRDYVIK